MEGQGEAYDIRIVGFVSFREGAIRRSRHRNGSKGRCFSDGAGEMRPGNDMAYVAEGVTVDFALDGVDSAAYNSVTPRMLYTLLMHANETLYWPRLPRPHITLSPSMATWPG